MEDVYSIIKEIIEEISFCDPEEIVPEASFTNDLGIDFDFDFPALIKEIEFRFGIIIPEEKYEDLFCVGELVNYVEMSKGI